MLLDFYMLTEPIDLSNPPRFDDIAQLNPVIYLPTSKPRAQFTVFIKTASGLYISNSGLKDTGADSFLDTNSEIRWHISRVYTRIICTTNKDRNCDVSPHRLIPVPYISIVTTQGQMMK